MYLSTRRISPRFSRVHLLGRQHGNGAPQTQDNSLEVELDAEQVAAFDLTGVVDDELPQRNGSKSAGKQADEHIRKGVETPDWAPDNDDGVPVILLLPTTATEQAGTGRVGIRKAAM